LLIETHRPPGRVCFTCGSIFRRQPIDRTMDGRKRVPHPPKPKSGDRRIDSRLNMDLRQRWIEQVRWTRQIAAGPQRRLSMRATIAIAAAFIIFGAWTWAVRYQECRANGFSMSYCATLSMRLR
jgi:hypothetical protein